MRQCLHFCRAEVAAQASLFACLIAILAPALRAETGYDAWLRYAPLPAEQRDRLFDFQKFPAVIVVLEDSPIIRSAAEELVRGVKGMTGRTLRIASALPDESAMVLITELERTKNPRLHAYIRDGMRARGEGYNIEHLGNGKGGLSIVSSDTEQGVLYGVFAILRGLALHGMPTVGTRDSSAAPIRIVNHWDNLDGTIERGYAGRSIFWENGHVREDLTRVRDYARLLASVGINGCSINNVNADVRVITPEYLPEVARIAEAMRPWGVKVYLSLNFAAPRDVGKIDTFDPLDERAVAFWKETVDRVYAAVPDLGGFVLKADSEGRLGPSEYGRTPADAANVIARAAKPHGGVLFYRGFVYNHLMDWRDPKNDRATAAYNNFHKLDGQFDDNVIVQIKPGPIDFQVREPASPLFSGLEKTNQAIELQITQEYLGQQKHLCFTAPMWKDVLDFDMGIEQPDKPNGGLVKNLVGGYTFNRPLGGFVGVSNVGRDENWLGHHLAMANLYGFGRLAWNPNLTSEQIADEWTRQTFGNDRTVVKTIVDMLLRSWPIYESYTGNLGIGTLTDIIHIHFGPAPESSEHNGWGQWHRANATGVGMDRTVATGTGFTAQYRPAVAAMFESLATCPEELLLFMHHVPYSHRLKSGKTVIQHIYDEHYAGAAAAAALVDEWRTLDGHIDEQRYRESLARLEFQAGHAQVWRDAVCRYFHKLSGIDDEQGRVGSYPGRIEAESAQLDGYAATEIEPWEAASNSKAAQLPAGKDAGSITFPYDGAAGWFDLRVQYFDEEDGVSRFRVLLNGQPLDAWEANDHVPTPTTKPDAHSSTRRTIPGVALRPGDKIRIEAHADAGERAGVDYIELVPIESYLPLPSGEGRGEGAPDTDAPSP
jgi:alpha-glucuronidase